MEYINLGHPEPIPERDRDKPKEEVFYMPIHVVYKEASTTTKIRAVFDASAKTSSGMSFNDTLAVGPTVHPQLLDVLLKFRMHKVVLTTNISKMYREVQLMESDKDFHRFVWREDQNQPLCDYRMNRATFGVAASCFAANMAVQKNAVQLAQEFPTASRAAQESFYVDDGLTGASSIDAAVDLRVQLQEMVASSFTNGTPVTLKYWNLFLLI